MKSKKVTIENVSIDEENDEVWIVVDNGNSYNTIYSIKRKRLSALPEEGDQIEIRWDDRRDNIELYYNNEILVK